MDDINDVERVTSILITDRFNSIDTTLRSAEMANDEYPNTEKISLATISSVLESIRAHLSIHARDGEWDEATQESYRNTTTDLCAIIIKYCSQNSIDIKSCVEQSVQQAMFNEDGTTPTTSFIHTAVKYLGSAMNNINVVAQIGDPKSDAVREALLDIPIGQFLAEAVIGTIVLENVFAP